MSYVIESHIPAPEPAKRAMRPKSQLRLVMESLLPGQSFLIDRYSDYDHARSAATYIEGKRFVTRKVHGEGWRVWRVV